MKSSDRIAMLYALGLAGAAGISYYRGRRGPEMLADVAIHGLVAGTAFNVADWLLTDEEAEAFANPLPNLPNPFAMLNQAHEMGKMGKKAIELLQEVDEGLYNDFKENGVKVGAIPPNPSMVNQDEN